MLHGNEKHTSKEEHAKVAGILLVVGIGHAWVLRAIDLHFNCKALLLHLECLKTLSLPQVDIADVAVDGSHIRVVSAMDLDHDGEGIFVYLDGLRVLSLLLMDDPDVVVGDGHDWVAAAVDIDVNVK